MEAEGRNVSPNDHEGGFSIPLAKGRWDFHSHLWYKWLNFRELTTPRGIGKFHRGWSIIPLHGNAKFSTWRPLEPFCLMDTFGRGGE